MTLESLENNTQTKLYTIVVAGKPQGPYTLEELKQFQILPGTFIRKPGMDDYKEAHEIEEIRQLMGFAVQITSPQYFASFDQRLMAWAIDVFLIAAVYAVLVFLSFLFVQQQAVRVILLIGIAVMVPITKLIYNIIADSSKTQGTIGKKLMDIKVTDMNGERINFTISLGRNFAKIVSTVTLGVGYIYSFFNKKQQCLHDVMAGTLVIKDRLL